MKKEGTGGQRRGTVGSRHRYGRFKGPSVNKRQSAQQDTKCPTNGTHSVQTGVVNERPGVPRPVTPLHEELLDQKWTTMTPTGRGRMGRLELESSFRGLTRCSSVVTYLSHLDCQDPLPTSLFLVLPPFSNYDSLDYPKDLFPEESVFRDFLPLLKPTSLW